MLHEVREGGKGREDSPEKEVLWKQFALDVAKQVTWKMTKHSHSCACVCVVGEGRNRGSHECVLVGCEYYLCILYKGSRN